MKYLVLTGNHPRHLYYLNSIVESCNVVGAILEKRESFIPSPPEGIELQDKKNFIKHFENRDKYETKYFGNSKKLPDCPIHYVSENTLSTHDSVDFIEKIKPDALFVFGILNIAKQIQQKLTYDVVMINLNTGLLQRYNGDATLFWPFYFLEPNWAGSTFHLIRDELDAGDIIHQSVPKLEKGDTIHEVACKVVQQSAKDVKMIIDILERGQKLKLHKQNSSGKNFLTKDFMPQHLRVIYNLYSDDIVDQFLDKKINSPDLFLIRQW